MTYQGPGPDIDPELLTNYAAALEASVHGNQPYHNHLGNLDMDISMVPPASSSMGEDEDELQDENDEDQSLRIVHSGDMLNSDSEQDELEDEEVDQLMEDG